MTHTPVEVTAINPPRDEVGTAAIASSSCAEGSDIYRITFVGSAQVGTAKKDVKASGFSLAKIFGLSFRAKQRVALLPMSIT